MTSPSPPGVSRAAPNRPRHPGEYAEPRLLRAPVPGLGTAALPRLPLCLGRAGRARVPAPDQSRSSTTTQKQPLTFSSGQAAALGLNPRDAQGRAATSSSRWRVPTTRRSPPPAISPRLSGSEFPWPLAVTSPGTRVLRLPSSPPLGRLRPPSHRLRVASRRVAQAAALLPRTFANPGAGQPWVTDTSFRIQGNKGGHFLLWERMKGRKEETWKRLFMISNAKTGNRKGRKGSPDPREL